MGGGYREEGQNLEYIFDNNIKNMWMEDQLDWKERGESSQNLGFIHGSYLYIENSS